MRSLSRQTEVEGLAPETVLNVTPVCTAEREALAACEAVIARGLDTFAAVGAALRTIRERKLYRAECATFDAYCRTRWGMSRPRAYQLMDAATVIGHLSTAVDMPTTERQARELAPLDPEAQRVVWELAVKTAPAGQVTAQHVRSLAAVAQGVLAAGAIDKGTGEMVHWDDLDANQQRALLEANLAEETFERLQRQKAHVSQHTGDHDWYTPAAYADAARDVLGAIDLDPASSVEANTVIRAARFYTAAEDGLAHPWAGRVWMNPPPAQPLVSQFADKLVGAVEVGTVPAAVVLVNNATETPWFQGLAAVATALCFPAGQVRLWRPGKTKAALRQGHAVMYLGADPRAFCHRFREFGLVLTLVRGA